MKILIIEDDDRTAQQATRALTEAGHVVDRAPDGREGLFLATGGGYDVIVLDRMLPGLDGLAVLGALRGAGQGVPVLILSALAHVDERVRGLKAGGDDYLSKPFAAVELVARKKLVRPREEVRHECHQADQAALPQSQRHDSHSHRSTLPLDSRQQWPY